jgi:hypothetical protein
VQITALLLHLASSCVFYSCDVPCMHPGEGKVGVRGRREMDEREATRAMGPSFYGDRGICELMFTFNVALLSPPDLAACGAGGVAYLI